MSHDLRFEEKLILSYVLAVPVMSSKWVLRDLHGIPTNFSGPLSPLSFWKWFREKSHSFT